MTRWLLLDIEGTTTAVDFVHMTLFPYARERLAAFAGANAANPDVREALRLTIETLKAEGNGHTDPIGQLIAWIDADRKHTGLKLLQGLIWREGYERGAFVSHVYADVAPALVRWRMSGGRVAIYSSGSEEAQRLLFGHTEAGDLTVHFSAHFDTRIGAKRDASSYAAIAKALAANPADVFFLSDIVAELDAARAAGMHATQVVRPGTTPGNDHPVIADFSTL